MNENVLKAISEIGEVARSISGDILTSKKLQMETERYKTTYTVDGRTEQVNLVVGCLSPLIAGIVTYLAVKGGEKEEK